MMIMGINGIVKSTARHARMPTTINHNIIVGDLSDSVGVMRSVLAVVNE